MRPKLNVDRIMKAADESTTGGGRCDLLKPGQSGDEYLTSFREEVRTCFAAMRSMLISIRFIALASSIAVPSSGSDGSEEELGLQEKAVELSQQYGSLKNDLLGNLSRLCQGNCHPTQAEIKQWYGQLVDFLRPRLVTFTVATGSFLCD